MSDAYKYNQRGVSADKNEVHNAIAGMDKGLFPNAFCKILPDIAGNDEAYCNIMHADTAGTKPSLAYMYWKTTGDISVWKGIVQDALVMNLDDMACVGCTDNIIISSTIARNKHLIDAEVISALIRSCNDFIEEMKDYGINIHHAGGETADVGDIMRTLDVGYTAFARMKREDLIINNIQPGDVIVGFASYGQTTYEQSYNGGMGSNGLTSARHDVFSHQYANEFPESYNPAIDKSVVFSGSKKLEDLIEIPGYGHITAGKLVLSPTRTYLPILKEILNLYRSKINGMIHCTGGGQTKVKKFIRNRHIIKDNLLPVPPLFELIQSESNTSWKEMYQVFNMGHRMEIYTDQETASALLDIAASFKLDAAVIGHVENHENEKVTLQTPHGIFEY
jgi:phosphoribosylformylglycinamidine cyclo-ligase